MDDEAAQPARLASRGLQVFPLGSGGGMESLRVISPAGNVRSALPVRPKSIPRELRDLPRWIAWTFESRGIAKKPAKIPISPRTSGRADVTNPQHLVGFDDALSFSRDKHLSGIGFAFLATDPFSGVDLDHVRDPDRGALDPFAQDVIEDLASYCEVSPSGRGVKLIARGKLDPSGRRRAGNVEVYDRSRYFALTGWRLPGSPRTIEAREDVLRRLQASLAPPAPPAERGGMIGGGFDGADHELLDRAFAARNGSRVRSLWDGRHGKATHSEGLLALATSLAFWTGPDAERLERLIVGSPLSALAEADRRKWGSRRRGGSWGRVYVVRKAIEFCGRFYSPPKLSLNSPTPVSVIGLQRAVQAADSGLVPDGIERLTSRFAYSTADLQRFASFAWHLAGRSPGGRFHLAVEPAGDALGIDQATVSRHTARLRQRGVLRLVKRGSSFSGRASEWEWRGLPAPGTPVAETCLPSEVPNDR